MSDQNFDIDYGFGRYYDMAFPHPLLDSPEPTEQDDEGSDFWANDPFFLRACDELEAQKEDQLQKQYEAFVEEEHLRLDRIQDAHLRRRRKKR